MIVSISGTPGSGKSTIAKRLAQELGFKRYYMGGMRRQAAKERGMTLEEYNRLGEEDPSTDLEVDRFQEELGRTEDDFVIEGRTSFHFIPHSFKVFLDVDLREAARRILHDEAQDERNEEVGMGVEEKARNLEERMASDERRYQKYFDIRCYDKEHYDLVIDTTRLTPDEVFERVLSAVKQQQSI